MMTIDEIQDALRFDMDMMLFDANTGKTYPKESLKYGNEMNYIHYCANEEAIELLEELKELRRFKEDFTDLGKLYSEIRTEERNKAIDDAVNEIVSVKSEVAEKEHFDTHLFTVLAQRQNEIIKLIKKLKEGGVGKNED